MHPLRSTACDFETNGCDLIVPPDEEPRCVEICAVGGQSDDFYTRRLQAIGAGGCASYLDCAP